MEMTDSNLPDEIVTQTEGLTLRARKADEAQNTERAERLRRRRDELLANHDHHAIERGDDTLVLHPDEWIEDGTVQPDRIEETDRAIERQLVDTTVRANTDADWERVADHNRGIAARVTEQYSEIHGTNAKALADFMSNHYATPIENATQGMVEEFRTEYYPRNAWPTEKQSAVIEKSIEMTLETARK